MTNTQRQRRRDRRDRRRTASTERRLRRAIERLAADEQRVFAGDAMGHIARTAPLRLTQLADVTSRDGFDAVDDHDEFEREAYNKYNRDYGTCERREVVRVY